jgi:hypothetical protein
MPFFKNEGINTIIVYRLRNFFNDGCIGDSKFLADDVGCHSCIFNILSKMIMKTVPPNNVTICAFNDACDMVAMTTWFSSPVYIPTITQQSALGTKGDNPNPTKAR